MVAGGSVASSAGGASLAASLASCWSWETGGISAGVASEAESDAEVLAALGAVELSAEPVTALLIPPITSRAAAPPRMILVRLRMVVPCSF